MPQCYVVKSGIVAARQRYGSGSQSSIDIREDLSFVGGMAHISDRNVALEQLVWAFRDGAVVAESI